MDYLERLRSTEFLFVVDTAQFAGRFAPEMGAYLTGVAEGNAFSVWAEELAAHYAAEEGERVNMTQFSDMLSRHESDGEHEPLYVAAFPTPGLFNNGHGGVFRDGEEEAAQAHYREACLAQSRARVHPQDQAAHAARWEARAEERHQVHHAYYSVALVFSEEPTPEQIELLRRRALAFPAAYAEVYGGDERIAVTGIRTLRKVTAYEAVATLTAEK